MFKQQTIVVVMFMCALVMAATGCISMPNRKFKESGPKLGEIHDFGLGPEEIILKNAYVRKRVSSDRFTDLGYSCRTVLVGSKYPCSRCGQIDSFFRKGGRNGPIYFRHHGKEAKLVEGTKPYSNIIILPLKKDLCVIQETPKDMLAYVTFVDKVDNKESRDIKEVRVRFVHSRHFWRCVEFVDKKDGKKYFQVSANDLRGGVISKDKVLPLE